MNKPFSCIELFESVLVLIRTISVNLNSLSTAFSSHSKHENHYVCLKSAVLNRFFLFMRKIKVYTCLHDEHAIITTDRKHDECLKY